MDQLFQPPVTDPLANKANTLPYVDNICQYLTASSAEWYRGLMRCFEEDRFNEETLELLVRDGHFFDGQPYVQYHHEDLVLVIILNKLDGTDQVATHNQEPDADINPTEKSRSDTDTDTGTGTKKQIKAVGKTQATARSASVPQTSRPKWKRSTPCEVCRKQKKRCKHLNPPDTEADALEDTD